MYWASRAIALFLVLPLLWGCEAKELISPPPVEEEPLPVILSPTEDYGQAYLDSLLFFGESTTYHMKDRGVLSGGRDTDQILAPDSGTVCLDGTTATVLVRDPRVGDYVSVCEAVARRRPSIMVLCFGLNGAVSKVRRGEDYFASCYLGLYRALKEASPHTQFILESAPPIASTMDASRYSVSAKELNGMIDTLNGWTRKLCEAEGLRYLNTAEILKGEDGFLREEYDVGDGHHLTRAAYEAILLYIRTHGYQ